MSFSPHDVLTRHVAFSTWGLRHRASLAQGPTARTGQSWRNSIAGSHRRILSEVVSEASEKVNNVMKMGDLNSFTPKPWQGLCFPAKCPGPADLEWGLGCAIHEGSHRPRVATEHWRCSESHLRCAVSNTDRILETSSPPPQCKTLH